jgi:hypothetical protein
MLNSNNKQSARFYDVEYFDYCDQNIHIAPMPQDAVCPLNDIDAQVSVNE